MIEAWKRWGYLVREEPKERREMFRLSKSQKSRDDSEFFLLARLWEGVAQLGVWRRGSEFIWGLVESWVFWGHSEGDVSQMTANFMVRRSVWEEKETDKDQLMDMSELEGKYVWNKSWRGQQQNPGDGSVYTLLYKQTLDKPWKDKGGKETRTLLRTTEWSSRTGAEERPLVIWSRKPVVTFERRVLVELL